MFNQAEAVRLKVRVCGDEHQQASPQVIVVMYFSNQPSFHLRIDELEDEIIREKLKINAVSGQLDDTFNEMLNKY